MEFLNAEEKAYFEKRLKNHFGSPKETERLYAWIDVLRTREEKLERMIIEFATEGQFTKIPNAAEKLKNVRETIRDTYAKIKTTKEELKK